MYPEGIELEVDSAAEAITALGQFEGFRPDDVPEGFQHSLILPDFQSPDAFYGRTSRTEIFVEPFMGGHGGKRMGWLQIGIGVALIAFSGGLAGIAASTVGGLSAAATSALAANIVMAGAMMVLGGLVAILMPQPSSGSSSADPSSNYLGGSGGNTAASGTPIPLLLGTFKCAGHYLGFNITATNLNDPGPPAVIDTYATVFSATVDSNFNITVNSTGVTA